LSKNKESSKIVIRELRGEDYDSLIALWKDSKLSHRPQGRDSREEIERQLVEPTSIFLAAEIDGMLVGAVLGTHDGRKGWINRLAVSPDHRKSGIARRLVEEVENRIYSFGLGIVAVFVEDWNSTSLEVFERLGYKRFEGIAYMTKRTEEEI
jgi:ribosomal protein S18 acetylase RimI-like enzyme